LAEAYSCLLDGFTLAVAYFVSRGMASEGLKKLKMPAKELPL